MKKAAQRSLFGVKHTALVLGTLLASSGITHATEIDATFSMAVGRSNNILRTDSNQIDEKMAIVGGEFTLVEATRKLNANIYANIDYIDYIDDSFDDEFAGGATALAAYSFVEEILDWTLEYNFGQQVFNPLAPIRPDNRENVSYLTTGPRLSLPLAARFELNANLSYSDISYEISPNSQVRNGGRLSIGRELSNGRTLALAASAEDVEYKENVVNPDYQRTGLFLRYESTTTRGTFSVDIGINELELDGVNQKSDGVLLGIDWLRTVSSSAEFQLSAGSRYSDQGDIFRFFQNARFDLRDTEDVAGVATPFRNNYATGRLSINKSRTTLDILALYSDEDYETDATLNREVIRLNLVLGRDFSRKTFGELGINALSRKFISVDRDDEDIEYTVLFGYKINPAFSATLSYQFFDRSTNQGVTEFNEDRVFLRISYVPKWAGR